MKQQALPQISITSSVHLTSCQSGYKPPSSRRHPASTSCALLALHSWGKGNSLLLPDPDPISYRQSRSSTSDRTSDRNTDTVTNLTENFRKNQGRDPDILLCAEKLMHLQFSRAAVS